MLSGESAVGNFPRSQSRCWRRLQGRSPKTSASQDFAVQRDFAQLKETTRARDRMASLVGKAL